MNSNVNVFSWFSFGDEVDVVYAVFLDAINKKSNI